MRRTRLGGRDKQNSSPLAFDGVRDGVDTAVNDNGTGFDPVTLDHPRNANCSHNDVRLPTPMGDIFRSGMAHRHGGVDTPQDAGHRRPDNLRPVSYGQEITVEKKTVQLLLHILIRSVRPGTSTGAMCGVLP